MNLRVGFFRLWAVLSLLWLSVFGVWGLYYGFTAKYEVAEPTGLKFLITAPRDTKLDDVQPFVAHSEAFKKRQAECAKDVDGRRGPWCDFEYPLEMPGIISSILRNLIYVISVPILVFVIGLLSFWVLSGFKKSVHPNS